jgi:single-stranded DNA-binding protein
MIAALISGTLFRNPEQRTAKTGRSFVAATLRVKDGEASLFVKIFAFSDHTKDELLRLQDGDALAVQGALRVETCLTASGATKVSLSVTADHVLALRQPPKKREAKASDNRTKEERQRATWTGPDDGPCDEIPF